MAIMVSSCLSAIDATQLLPVGRCGSGRRAQLACASAGRRTGIDIVGSSVPKVGPWARRLPTIFEEAKACAGPAVPRTAAAATASPPAPARLASSTKDVAQASAALEALVVEASPERFRLTASIAASAAALGVTKDGSVLLQRCMEVANAHERELIIQELASAPSAALQLARSRYGHHALLKLIEVAPTASVAFLISALEGHGVEMATHRCGSCVLERLFEQCSQEWLRGLYSDLEGEIASLARNEYGNFVVQRLFEYGEPAVRARVLERLLPVASALLTHRYGRHAVQRVLDFGAPEEQVAVVRALLDGAAWPSLAEVLADNLGRAALAEFVDSGDRSAVDELHRGLAAFANAPLELDGDVRAALAELGVLVE